MTPSMRRRKNAFVVTLMMYLILFGSGIYCGVALSEAFHESLQGSGREAESSSVRNRNLMSTDVANERNLLRGERIASRTEFQPQGRVNGRTSIDKDKTLEVLHEIAHREPLGGVSIRTSLGEDQPSEGQRDIAHQGSFGETFLNSSDELLESLPYSKPIRRTQLPKIYKTTKSIAGCLFIMDDSIRLLEWLAYHYTVLPLSNLMVAIDPNSQKSERIMEILDSWKGKIHIKAYRNDTEWLDLPWDYGYSRNIRTPNGKLMKWYREKKSEVYFGQVHKRRQNYFCVHCMRYMKERGMDWTIITDSDEYLMFNYQHEEQEDRNLYDSLKRGTSIKDVDKEREVNKPYRERLPAMETRATIADYIHQEKLPSKCIMFPGLQFTSYESQPGDVYKGVPSGINPYQLVTLRHRLAGQREGSFSKTMVDVSHGTLDDYTMETNVNVHVPNKLLCGMNGNSGSRKDYISSVFRLHHYRTGTWESFIERASDRRANMTVGRFMERNIEPRLVDDDIRPWTGWFIEKVGMDEAKRLLIDPLDQAYSGYSRIIVTQPKI